MPFTAANHGPFPTLLDALAEVHIDIAKIFEGALQNWLAHAVEQVAHDVVDQAITLGVGHDVSDQGAGLTPVVIVGPQSVSGADHFTVGMPPGGLTVVLDVRLRATLRARACTGSLAN